ncbi:ARM repeat-containing protein, partial [Lepidopterella palustris CBS 459.81]
SRKSSTQTLKSRASASTRTSALAVEIPDEGPTTSLRSQICSIFADAQRNTATQRKLIINLRKIQEACCYEPTKPRKQQKYEDFGEREFNEEIGRCFIRVLPVKKSEPVGDRIVRFLGLFLKHASEKDNEIAQPEEADETEVFPETPSSRLTSHILSLILPLLTAKDKTVRFRSTQIVAHIVNTLDSIDDELFQLVRVGLLKRLRDKEAAVRVQAVLGLGRLAGEGQEDEEDEDSDDDVAGGILEKLLDVLQNDPSAEVRRSLLLNLPFTPSTLPYLLERARDFDAATRRALYSRLLPALGDFRHLSLTHREKLLRWGLRDRDENVRKATARLFRERWIEDCARSHQPDEEDGAVPGQVSKPSYDALLELLERIDVVNSGVEGGIAFEAIKEFWDGRPDYRDFIAFDDDFWNDLAPESIFVARTYNDYCRLAGDSKLQDMIEDKMPEVTKFAFFVQKHLNKLIEDVRKIALQEQEDAEAEEDTVQQEFCVEQLLHIALTLDYSDEVGRRQMFSIMREALALAELPEECTKLVVEVLRTVCGGNVAGEREFCGIVLEAVAEVHDTIMGEDPSQQDADESFHSARSELSDDITPTKANKAKRKDDESAENSGIDEEKAIREIMVNMKCLHIAQCMLQNVQCDLEQNSVLVTMLNNLVVPAVRSQEAPIRERGLLCLGLCCLLSKNLASENLTLFLHCFTKGHEALQTIAIQIITDILITHPTLIS